MERRAARLTEYVRDRVDDQIRAVGYYADAGTELTYVRPDLEAQYGPERIRRFVEGSRSLHSELLRLDEELGKPEASLHVLTDGLVVQFHYGSDDVVFLAMERDVGRNFVKFVDECKDRMDPKL